MRMIPVVVTSVGGNVGQGVVKALRASRLPFRVIGVDMEPRSAGFAFVHHHYVVPQSGSPEFVAQMQEIQARHAAEAMFVCSAAEIGTLAAQRETLERELGMRILVNPERVVAIGCDKLRTVEFLAAAGLPHPQTALATDAVGVEALIAAHGWPVLLKPRGGASSRHVFVAETPAQIAAAQTFVPDLVVQQYLPDATHEYTAGTVSDAQGRVRAAVILRRDLLQGTTYRTELVEDSDLTVQVTQVVHALGAVGPCNVQFRLLGDTVVPFEINPRFSGTSGIRYLYGFNDAELTYRLLCAGEEIAPPTLRPGVVLRYWNEVLMRDCGFDDVRFADADAGDAVQGVQVVI